MSDAWSFGRAERPDELIIERHPDIPFKLVGYEVVAPCDCVDAPGEPAPEDVEEVIEHAEGCNSITRKRLVAGEEVEVSFRAWGDPPRGSTMRLMAGADIRGNADVRSVAKWIQATLIEEDKDRFWDTIDDPAIHFEADAIMELAKKLMEVYGERPTQSRSARRAGVRHNGRTSVAVPAGRASS